MNKEKLKQILISDGWLKVISVIIAVISWFFITTMVTPDSSRTIVNVPISTDLAGTVAASNGLMISDMNQTTIDVRVTGKSYLINTLQPSDFKVVMNLSGVTTTGTVEISLQVDKVDFTNPNYIIDTWTPYNVKVTFEKMDTKVLEVTAKAPNVQVADGLMLGEPVATPTEITVSGAHSQMSRLARCVIETTDRKTIETSQTFPGKLHFYDEYDVELEKEKLFYTTQEYRVDVPVYKKTTLPLTFDYINIPDGVDASLLQYSQNEQTIVVGLPVEITKTPEKFQMGVVDFRSLDLGKRLTFSVQLPHGWKKILAPETVTIEFLTTGLDSVRLSSKNIIQKNLPANYTVQLLTQRLSDIYLVGDKQVIQSLTSEDIVVTIDFSNVKISSGDQQIPVTITLVGRKQAWVVGTDYAVMVHLESQGSS